MRRRVRRLGLALVAVLGVLAVGPAGCSPGRGPFELKVAHSGPPESLIGLAADEFARRANERLGDRATVVVFGSSLLGGDEVVLQKVKLGTVHMSLTSTVLSSLVDALALFEMPYLVRDRQHMRRIEEELFWSALEPRVEEEGYKVIAVWENGFRHVTNNVRPIVTPDDLRGLKMRTPRSPWRVKVFEAFGANPSPLSFSELFMALQTGVMDGQENPLSNIVTSGLHEVQEYLSLTRHVYSPAYLTVGAEQWARLPADVRQMLEETAREVQGFVLETAEELDTRLLRELRDAGMQINEADRESFVKASQAIYNEFDAVVPGGRELIDRALALARR
jgi:tripartite ATP-independent transporter DctP family solute receptor